MREATPRTPSRYAVFEAEETGFSEAEPPFVAGCLCRKLGRKNARHWAATDRREWGLQEGGVHRDGGEDEGEEGRRASRPSSLEDLANRMISRPGKGE